MLVLKSLAGGLALAVTFALARPADAATVTWTNATGGNWSASANWNPNGAPGTTASVVFADAGAGSPNTNDIPSETINALTYSQDNGSTNTTVINPGQTLTINSTVAANNGELYAGSTSVATTAATLVPVAIQGATSTLALTGAGDIWVAQGNTSSGTHMATLDLSGLGTFTATVGRLYVGVNINGINRPSGTLLLAATNNITLTGGSPQVQVQESGVNANGGTVSVLSFGQQNQLYADTMRFGGDKGNGTVNFNSAFSLPSLKMRNSNGVSPCTVIDVGYNAFVTTGNGTTGLADFSLGTVDILANVVHIAQGNPGPGTGSCTGTLTIGAGTLTVPDLEIGYGNATGANTGGTTGTLNVNNNGLFSTGAVVTCSTVLNLARTNGPTSTIVGTLNVNGGAVNANTITSGGGISSINLNSGTLVVSNTAGSLALPIRFFSIGNSGGATLNVPLSFSGSTIVASNFTTSGANQINITAVPGIATYPATFTVIQYQGTENGNGPGSFTLGSLPAASPSYAGTIVDTGNGVVQVKLTTGPVAVLATTWTGANDNNWDYTTMNWLYQAGAADFVDGRATIFNDTPTQTNLLLDATPLSPSSVTVSNNLKQYTFGGTGRITTGTLTKSGTSSLTLDNSGGNNNISAVVINGGTLQMGAGDANGGINTVNVTNNGALVVERTDNVTLSAAITGSGTLTQGGSGTLVLSGANSYNGATSVTNGTLELDQTTSGTGPVTSSAGTVLSGLGVVSGPVTVGGKLSPGSPALPGNFQAGNGLTLAAGSTASFGLSPTDTSTSDNSNDSVAVTGNLTVHSNVINVNFAGAPLGGIYTLFSYTGILSGSFNPVVTGTHFTVALDTNTAGFVNLDVTGSSGYNLEWTSTLDGTWDTVATNWLNLANSAASTFAAGDTVLLDDTSGVQTAITIGSGVTVYPAAITNTANNNNFIISGAGGIGGSASIVKTGTAFLNLATANSFTGPVDIQAGTLVTQNGAALGRAASTTIENGASLDLDGQNLGGTVITVSGAGVNNSGAIINSGAADFQAIRSIVLAGNTTFGGIAEWEMNNGGGAASLSTGGNSYNLTKVSANVIVLQNLATFDTNLADIDIKAGTLLFNGSTPGMGDPAHTLTIETGAQLAFGSDQVTYNKNFVINGDGSTQNINNEGGANVFLAGTLQLNGNCVLNVGGTQLGISANISGTGGIIKSAGSLLILTGANTYTGDTVVNGGTLQLTNGATLSTSSNITLAAGTSLDMHGAVLTLVSGQSLNGNGTVINGSLVASAGSTVSPGVGAVGKLTVNSAVTLSGTSAMDLDPANNTNDVLSSSSTITYGGTLSLANLSPLSGGNSFKLFNASSYSGSFASISPATPGAGMIWDTSALGTSGTIKVVSVPRPHITSISVNGTTLKISATNGTLGGQYVLLGTTNVALPLSQWKPLLTNHYDGSGNLNLTTNIISLAVPRQFYILSQ